MSAARLRAAALPIVAAVLVSGVLGVELARGGADFAPARPVPPCAPRVVTSVSTGLDGLGERLVLIGLDAAACRLGTSREALTLELARSRTPSAAQVGALRAGLLDAVARMKAAGTLPRISALTDEALARAHLNPFVELAVRALPDAVIDAALRTDDVLRRTIDDLDLRRVLADLDRPDELTRQLDAAVSRAVREALVARLRGLV